LSVESWIRVIEHVSSAFPGLLVVLTGGEPLTYTGLPCISEALHRTGVRWGMVTNGVLLDEQRLGGLIEHGMSSITISLDGPATVHDWLRNRRGAYDSAITALRIVAQRAIPHADVVTCVTPRVLDRLDETAEIIMNTGIREWRLFRIFPAGRARDNPELLLDNRQTDRLLAWIASRRRNVSVDGLEISYGCEGWVPQQLNRRIRNPLSMCRAGINIASILNDGTMTGCPNNDPRFYVGNIVDAPIRELWENGFEDFRNRSWLARTACGACRFVRHCRGSSIHLWRSNASQIDFCYLDCGGR
jgi:radical SAM protein with 4Fe4S-binding SPASM domain